MIYWLGTCCRIMSNCVVENVDNITNVLEINKHIKNRGLKTNNACGIMGLK